MTDILDSAQIATLRSDWIGDEVDLRPEWGASPTIGTASAGAVSAVFSGLTSGTIAKGTEITILHGNRSQTYYVTADADIASNAATVAFTPVLYAATSAGTAVAVKEKRRSTYNRKTGQAFFDDEALQRIADLVEQKRGSWIYGQDNPSEARFRCIRIECFRRYLASDVWQKTIIAGEQSTATSDKVVSSIQAQLADDERIVEADDRGPRNLRFVR